jgi:hypothetical protein
MAIGMDLTAEQLDQLTEDQVAEIGKQLFSLIMPSSPQSSPNLPRRQQLPVPGRPNMGQRPQQMRNPLTQQSRMPPKIPRGQGNMVKQILQNRSQMQQPLPNPMSMQRQMPQQQMMQPQYQQPSLYRPLNQPMAAPSGPFMAMNPYQM